MWTDIGKGLSILLINIVLSGDNALMIAMVTARLPQKQRMQGMVFGLALTVILRVGLTLIAGKIFFFPYLEAIGGFLLVYFAFSLLHSSKQMSPQSETQSASSTRLFGAVFAILVADLSMSLDNVIALAGIADGNWGMLLIGMALSLLIILLVSQVLSGLLIRYGWLMYIGSAILAWTGGEMIGRDAALSAWLSDIPFLPVWITVIVFLIAYGFGKIRSTKS